MEMIWKRLRGSEISTKDLLSLYAIEKPPVPIIGLAQSMGVEVYYRPKAPWDGMLSITPDGNTARVFIKKEASETRQRFTIAHELAHLILHPGQNVYRDTSYMSYNSLQERRRETEANQYAAELLMPDWMVEFAFYRMKLGPSKLASLFNVSAEAMKYRLKYLRILPSYL